MFSREELNNGKIQIPSNEKYDLIFIDGDHSYEGILNDTKKTFYLRRSKKSVIVWHDYGWTTEKVRYSTLKAILDGVPDIYHKNLFHISNTLCAVFLPDGFFYKKETTTFLSYPSKPETIFKVEVNF